MSEQHAKFQQRFIHSSRAVFAHAEHLHVSGYRVEIPPLRVAPTAADHAEYADDGDLFVLPGGDWRVRYEVKGLGYDFESRGTWPHRRFYVDRKHRIDSEFDKISAWVYLNPALTHFALVLPHTRPHWFVHNGFNSKTGNYEDNYCCPLELVDFYKLKRIENVRLPTLR